MTDRAVSEVLGFALVFTLITSSAILVYVGGLNGLEGARDNARVENAGHAMEVLADNVDKVARGDAPSRTTKIELQEASIGLGDPTRVTVRTNASAGGDEASVEFRPIVYAVGDSKRLVYEGGAVIRSDGRGLLRHEPRFLFGRERTLLTIVNTEQVVGSTSIGGTTSAYVTTERVGARSLVDYREGPYEVEMTVESRRAGVWRRYLERELEARGVGTGTPCSRSGRTVTCSFVTDELTVTETRVGVALSGN